MVILTDRNGIELRKLKFYKLDVDVNDTMDFELKIPSNEIRGDEQYGCRIFVPDTEYGGIIGEIKIDTASDEICLYGTSWRGFINNKILRPLSGQDYRIVSGELNTIISSLFSEYGLTIFRVPSTSTGVTVTNYQFNRYTTLYKGITAMLESVGYRLDLKYVQGERGNIGYIKAEAVKVVDYSSQIEYSQDNRLDFIFEETANKCNHLICLGSGELASRQVLDLYIQQDGSVGSTQYYTGVNEVVEIYDYPNVEGETDAEKLENLRIEGTEKLLELTNTQTFDVSVDSLVFEMNIGDIIGGRDRITGLSMSKPVTNKIYNDENGIIEISYTLKGDNQKEDNIIQ